jgi:hypothetical protein
VFCWRNTAQLFALDGKNPHPEIYPDKFAA